MRICSALAIAILGAGCAIHPNPVPVIGAAGDLRELAGEWNGEYRSNETGRTGSITFKLSTGRDTAYGDVVMIPREQMPSAPETAMPTPPVRQHPQVLTISFVRVSGTTIFGTIRPYKSPDCGCELLTTFRGDLLGDRIEGDFVIRHSEHHTPPQKGTWWATRTRIVASP